MKPRSIKIAGKRHKIKWNADLDGDCGLIEHLPLEISVGVGMAPDEERESLFHEIVHACEYQQGLRLKEKQVRQLSVGLFEALRSNPKLVEYLMSEEDGDAAS